MADQIMRSPNHSPNYSLHRSISGAVDSLPETDSEDAMNMNGYDFAHVQVVPSGGSDPTVKVMWWSEEASEFIDEVNPISYIGQGVNTSYEFTVNARGRKMFVAVVSNNPGKTMIYVSGSTVI